MSRVPVRHNDLAVGLPAKWDVLDADGKIFIKRGSLIESAQTIVEAITRRCTRDLDLGAGSAEKEGTASRRAGQNDEREVRLLLEDTRIKPGDPIQLQEANGQERLPVKLIGYQKNRSVIVTNPLQNGTPIFLREGTPFVARLFSGQLAFAFKTTVLANPVKPYPYVHLAYPADVAGLKVRRDERVRLRTIVAFDLDSGKNGSGVFANLSTGGALLFSRSADIALGAGIVTKFKLVLGGLEYVLELPGVVRANVQNLDEPELGAGYGLQFAEVSAEDSLIISAFVFQQLVENKAL